MRVTTTVIPHACPEASYLEPKQDVPQVAPLMSSADTLFESPAIGTPPQPQKAQVERSARPIRSAPLPGMSTISIAKWHIDPATLF